MTLPTTEMKTLNITGAVFGVAWLLRKLSESPANPRVSVDSRHFYTLSYSSVVSVFKTTVWPLQITFLLIHQISQNPGNSATSFLLPKTRESMFITTFKYFGRPYSKRCLLQGFNKRPKRKYVYRVKKRMKPKNFFWWFIQAWPESRGLESLMTTVTSWRNLP